MLVNLCEKSKPVVVTAAASIMQPMLRNSGRNQPWSINNDQQTNDPAAKPGSSMFGIICPPTNQLATNNTNDPEIVVKQEPPEDTKNDSGLSTDISTSPASYRGSSSSAAESPQAMENELTLSYILNDICAKSRAEIAQPQQPTQPQPEPEQKPQPQPLPQLEQIQEQQPNATPKKAKAKSSSSRNKIKNYQCKQCPEFTTSSQQEFWDHRRIHVDPAKLLYCHLCSFCTPVKHHYEFHMHNHEGRKPFKCDQCEYECVNKSMLTSHLKSHLQIYPYECSNCKYHTKYLHSFKQHLKSMTHSPGRVLNPDGTINTTPIDVYGTRRGPRQRNLIRYVGCKKLSPLKPLKHLSLIITESNNTTTTTTTTNNNNNNNNNNNDKIVNNNYQMKNPASPLPSTSDGERSLQLPPPQQQQQQQQQPQLSPLLVQSVAATLPLQTVSTVSSLQMQAALSASFTSPFHSILSNPFYYGNTWPQYNPRSIEFLNRYITDQQQQQNLQTNNNLQEARSVTPETGLDLRSRSPVDDMMEYDDCEDADADADDDNSRNNNSDDNERVTTAFPYVEAVVNNASAQRTSPVATPSVRNQPNQKVYEHICPYCDIGFGQETLYIIHMGIHRSDDPLTCNLCSRSYNDYINFYSHIIKRAHY